MYEEDTKWVSQTLISYKDDIYETDGYLRVSISTSTKDYKFFNPPMIGISISNQFQKSYNLNIINASDLLQSFKYAFENSERLFSDKSQIVKQNKTIQFIMEFTKSQDQLLIVKLIIKGGESDFTKIIIPVEIFQSLANRVKYFVNSYDEICLAQYKIALQGETNTVLLQLPSLIKGMPSQILSGQNLDSTPPPPEKAVEETEMTISDLDQFVGGQEMKNIKVAELGEKKDEPVTEVKSEFISDFLKGDLRNLETMLNNTSSFEEIGNKIRQSLTVRNKDDFSMLPGISDDEVNSLSYISKLLVNTIELSWTTFESPIPSSTPILKYKAKDNVLPENIELAYDLLLLSGYIRTVRRRLEDKISDANENRSLFHLKFRCYLDPYYFSFIEKSDKTKLSSIIVNRFKYYDSLGFFKEYKNTLQMHNCIDITVQDISTYIEEVADKVIGKSLFIIDQHDKLMVENNFKIGSKSNFNKEQIINEIVPLEIAEVLGQDTSGIEVSDEIKNFFKGKKETKNKVVPEKKNHLVRVVGTLKNDIPDQYKEDFIEWIKEFDSKNFVFDNKFPYVEFGDDLIKALYVWKPEDDSRIASSLKHYQTQIENEVMEKQYILAVDEKKDQSEISLDNINWDL